MTESASSPSGQRLKPPRPESANTWKCRWGPRAGQAGSQASVRGSQAGGGGALGAVLPATALALSRRLRRSSPRPRPGRPGQGGEERPGGRGGRGRAARSDLVAGAAACRDAGTFGAGAAGSGRAAGPHRGFRPGQELRGRALSGRREASAGSSARSLSRRAPLGRAFSGVLAAPAAAVRAAAWLLLWEAAALTCAPATALSVARTDAGIRSTCSEIILRQEVLKDGFHRDLLIKVKFGESIEDLQTCKLLIKHYIPTGLFVDPYELASLRERNITEEYPERGHMPTPFIGMRLGCVQFNYNKKIGWAVMVSETFDIEAPNYLSMESEVLIYARQDSQCIDCFHAFLPVHYRYHRPHNKDGETFIVINNPDLLMCCDQEFPILKCWSQSEVAAPCTLKNKDICQWNNMKYKSVYKNVTLQVPVGLTIHTSLVCFVTLLITILCSTLILVAVFKYGHFSL